MDEDSIRVIAGSEMLRHSGRALSHIWRPLRKKAEVALRKMPEHEGGTLITAKAQGRLFGRSISEEYLDSQRATHARHLKSNSGRLLPAMMSEAPDSL